MTRGSETTLTYDHGVQSGAGEARSTSETLGGLKFRLEIGLLLDGAIGLGCTVVEPLINGGRGRERQGRNGEKVGEHHVCKIRKRQ